METLPAALVINVTLQCPLKCAHCCYSSDMFKAGHLSFEQIALAISQAAGIQAFRAVHFVGGDPLLHPDLLADAIALAAGLGLSTGITTSAFWAKSPGHAQKVVDKLCDAGLSEITVSYDDAHAAFLGLHYIANAVAAAVLRSLKLRIAVVVEPGAAITAATLRAQLGLQEASAIQIYETAVNSTGRAAAVDEVRLHTRTEHAEVYRGACQSVFRNVQIDPQGNVIPCCGVLPHHSSMVVGNLVDDGLEIAVARAQQDPLYRWISKDGPVAILADITAADTAPMRTTDFDGICTACDRMFSSPLLLRRARHTAAARCAEGQSENVVLKWVTT
ncbi:MULTISPECIES: radical SAM/SPASM domain-containing protein [Pseudomonas]|uniref:Radical SAM protein n=1 Tax=Pseudomonas wuhanensis TaxID=2954098 RepID=A0ABY9GV04_9PSED|nr:MULTISPECIES: radical SAM/SPASM domain-containing protein [unclassified Pseudomonas]WLI13455.1 radical SAM protein [Pseudomonas sp. FP603]WLI19342.1 radical SAM protein [Pseudomonas sp. FP607]